MHRLANVKLSEAERESIRMDRVGELTRKYDALVRQEELDRPKGTGHAIAIATGYSEKFSPNGILVPSSPIPAGIRQFKTDEEADDYIKELETHYSGKTLRPENRSIPYVGLRYFSNDLSSPPADPRLPELRKKLLSLGFRLTEIECLEEQSDSKTKQQQRILYVQMELQKTK